MTFTIDPLRLSSSDRIIEEFKRREITIPMVLFCPACDMQHIDYDTPDKWLTPGWTNPPHRSHECQSCHHIWRLSDYCTKGVESIATTGKNDNTADPQFARLKFNGLSVEQIDQVINLDEIMWNEIKNAIINSPKFKEMYDAGGMLNDGVSNVISWLREE